MKYARLGDVYVVRLATDEEIVGSIVEFARMRSIDAASVSGIGAAHHVALGYFDRQVREYIRHTIDEEVEIVSLQGSLALKEGGPYAHLHAVVSGRDFRPMAGHLFEARVGATCELIVTPFPGYLQRTRDERTTLFLLDL